VKSLNVSVIVLRGAGGAGGTYGGRPLVGSEITNLGGGALRPSTIADGGTFGEPVPPNKAGVIAALPITKVSRKKRDPVTVVVFMRRVLCCFTLQ
jgi:hypothetical protein